MATQKLSMLYLCNNNNNNLTCKAPVCAKKTSVALANGIRRRVKKHLLPYQLDSSDE